MKKKNPIHAYKRLMAKDEDWSYSFLIALEKKKLQRMHDCTVAVGTGTWVIAAVIPVPATSVIVKDTDLQGGQHRDFSW